MAKDNNCMAGQKGKSSPWDKPYTEDVAILSGWDNHNQ